MNKKPIISIITINYNNLEGLKRTFKSVINQTWKEFEFIVIDGNSTDGSKELILENKNEIDYWVSEPDKGIYNAMNKGIKAANGEYLLFLNSGDHFYTDNILKENNKFITNEDFVYFDLFVPGAVIPRVRNPKKISFLFFFKDTLSHQATFIKKSLFDKIGYYDESLKVLSDWKFFVIAICKHYCTYKKVDAILSTFYMDGISSQKENSDMMYKEKRTILEEHFKYFVNDYDLLDNNMTIIKEFRKSRKIKLLIRLGLLNKF